MSDVVLIRPVINEKSFALIKLDQYTFEVGRGASKQAVKKAVADKFKVEVLDIKIVSLPSKQKMQRTRKGYFEQAGSKKALVKIKKGQKIAIFETEKTKDEVVVTTGEGEPQVMKEKKSLLKGTKIKVEKSSEAPKRTRQQAGKTKGEK